jgi:hypothetical protein
MNSCSICNNKFRTLKILKSHQKNAIYCKKLQNIQVNKCEYCKKTISDSNYSIHKENCIDYYKTVNNDNEFKNNKLEEENKILKLQLKELQYKLNDITLKLIDKQSTNTINNYNTKNNTITTNNTKVDIFNSLTPLTDNDFINNVQNLTLEHIKKGPEGYADFSLNFPLKDKIMCVDYARKKVCFKNEDGDRIDDPKMSKICMKLFKFIDEKNRELIKSYMDDIRNEMEEIISSTEEFEDNKSIEALEFNNKMDENQKRLEYFLDMYGNTKKTIKGMDNSFYTELVSLIIDKIRI